MEFKVIRKEPEPPPVAKIVVEMTAEEAAEIIEASIENRRVYQRAVPNAYPWEASTCADIIFARELKQKLRGIS